MATSTRKCCVGILTHEDLTQHEQADVGMLTQFFLDNNNVATGVKTFVVDNAIGDRVVTLVRADNYSKTVCQVVGLRELQYTPTSVMFIRCHGSAKSDRYGTPYLGFSGDADRNILYPCSGFSRMLWLHHVICKSKLVFLMCCNGDENVAAYLKEESNDFPDIVYINCRLVMKITWAIFVGWLIKLIDSDDAIGCNPTAEELYRGVKRCVWKIMYEVQRCEDFGEFFENLTGWGCIAKYTTEKEQEQQALPSWRFHNDTCIQEFYRVYGHTKNEWMRDAEKELLFTEFRALTLVERGGTTPVYKTCANFTANPSEL